MPRKLFHLRLHVADFLRGEVVFFRLHFGLFQEFQEGHFLGEEEEQGLAGPACSPRRSPDAVNVVLRRRGEGGEEMIVKEGEERRWM